MPDLTRGLSDVTSLADDVSATARTLVLAGPMVESTPFPLIVEREAVFVTARSHDGLTLTVIRGIDDTAASAHLAGAAVGYRDDHAPNPALLSRVDALYAPADVTLDETPKLDLILAPGTRILAVTVAILTPTAPLSTPSLVLSNATSAGATYATLASLATVGTVDGSGVLADLQASYSTAPWSPIVQYTAGLTPGATRPKLRFRLLLAHDGV